MKIFCLIFVVGLPLVLADTPAQCMYADIEGTWEIRESNRTFDSSITCDNIEDMEFPYTKTFKLSYPDLVTDEDLGTTGTWTMIYNQGFEFTINERSYFAFSYYYNNSTEIHSVCDETFPGWSRDKTVRNWSCYTAKKKESIVSKLHLQKDIPDINKMYKINYSFIDKINSGQYSWRAKAYPEFEQYTYGEMQARRGVFANSHVKSPSTAPITKTQRIKVSMYPDYFDWRNVSGINYVSDVRDQLICGSCYAFAALGTMEARLRIASNNERQNIFSPQDIVDCSLLSQGCAGGFSYLIGGRYAQDQGVVDESCNPYKGMSSECHTKQDCERTYVSEYRYIGGYYGACNEAIMIEELITGGPFAIGFDCDDSFSYYQSGVYVCNKVKIEFDPLVVSNHAMLVVGYGYDEESKLKYWTVKNSWGSSWGENGYVRIKRGDNGCGIESEGFAMTIIP